jgi:hypothetical protein
VHASLKRSLLQLRLQGNEKAASTSRVRQLEEAVFVAQGTVPGPIYGAGKFTEISGTMSSNGQGDALVLNTKAGAVRAYRRGCRSSITFDPKAN